jgi:predicted transcriptional regulator
MNNWRNWYYVSYNETYIYPSEKGWWEKVARIKMYKTWLVENIGMDEHRTKITKEGIVGVHIEDHSVALMFKLKFGL